jgi:NTP pyrophosphatase (non-canonical NTP hydrolase)
MKLNDYQRDTARTAGTRPREEALAMCGLGISGEAGEVSDIIKKHLFHGHPFDIEGLKKELGDVLWYVAAIADRVGISLEDVAEANLEKLRKRYPNGFSVEASRNRSGE